MTRQPRRLLRVWAIVRDGLPTIGRYRRYIRAAAPFVLAIWLVTIAYAVLTPPSYTSRMTLILPGSGVGGTMDVESLGHATTISSSAFANSTLSPTENYKRLITSDVTVEQAAATLGIKRHVFPIPNVKLTDQTNLIQVEVRGRTPEEARARLQALRTAFLSKLDKLRADEASAREKTNRQRIATLKEKARTAQRRVLDFQGRTGLVSLDQFNTRIADLDRLDERRREAETELIRQRATASALARSLRVSLPTARQAMLLKADPIFQSLLARYATLATDRVDRGATLGDANGAVVEAQARKDEMRAALVARGSAISDISEGSLLQFADLSVDQSRAQLMVTLVNGASVADGARAGVDAIRAQIAQQNGRAAALVTDAATLSDLLRDQRVAEAVFSSALARIDTDKADPFASYPLVQTFEAPSLPVDRAAPSLTLALAGALDATILTLIGFLLLWLRQPILRKLLPNA